MKRTGIFVSALFCLVLMSVSAMAQSVVVNKYQNSGTTADIVELLVIENNLDMRGMILKDFSSSMANDGGGKYQFSNDALWSSVPAGTLIVLRNNNSAADTSVGGSDFNLDIGLQNPTYFSNLGGTFDIATVEMVMMKMAGSGAAGVSGSIHALAGGAAGAQFNAAASPKLRASGSAGAGQFIYANNGTQSIADFNGTDATGAATALTFGSGNNATNTAYINSLRNPGPVVEPTLQASAITFSNIGTTSLTINWTKGNGSSRIVLAKAGSPVDGSPADGTAYAANPTFGDGDEVGTGNRVVFSGTGSSVNISGLASNTTYHFAIFEFNGSGATSDYLTTAPAVANQTTAISYTISGRVQTPGGAGIGGVALTLTGGPSPTTATTDTSGNYSFTNVAGGTGYVVAPAGAAFSFTPASQSFANLSDNKTANFTARSNVLISEFRLRGTDPDAGGPLTAETNEFIELYNRSSADINIAGWSLVSAGGVVLYTVPGSSLVLPAQGHYLVVGTGYGLNSLASPDATLISGTDIPDGAGLALFNNSSSFTLAARMDAVGFDGISDALYLEGTGLTPTGGVPVDGEYSFVRRMPVSLAGVAQDTDDNQEDFLFIATDGGVYNGRTAVLGTPGPENLSSPVQRNAQISAALVDPLSPSASSPNRVRIQRAGCPSCNNTTSNLGTLDFRRTFTNNTGLPVTKLRLRVIDLTTLNGPGYVAGGAQADLRLLTSSDILLDIDRDGTFETSVKGTTLETPPAQAMGGGLNASVTVTLPTAIPAGGSVNLRFTTGVQQSGQFRFFTNVEAQASAPASSNEHMTMGNPSNAVTSVSNPTNYLMEKSQYALSYNRDRGIPNWTSWHLQDTWLGGANRQDDYRNDTTLPAGWYQVMGTDYSGSGYDRGHMTPSADRTVTVTDNSATFLMTNMIPQLPANNQGPWASFESYCRTLVGQGNELYIISGGQGAQGTIANGNVTIPAQTWKVVVIIPKGDNDVSRVTAQTRTIAIIIPNSGSINTNWRTYRVSVDQVEALTGYDFFSNVPVNIQSTIEAIVDNQ